MRSFPKIRKQMTTLKMTPQKHKSKKEKIHICREKGNLRTNQSLKSVPNAGNSQKIASDSCSTTYNVLNFSHLRKPSCCSKTQKREHTFDQQTI